MTTSSLTGYNIHQTYPKLSSSKYELPLDDDEVDRHSFHHSLVKFLTQSNFAAPVEDMLRDGCKTLDVGCSSGIWCLEMATDFPNSKFTGFDIASTFPMDVMPNNVNFLQADLLAGIPFNSDEFGYVHLRFVNLGIPKLSWNDVIKDLVRVTKPGGWIEICEAKFTTSSPFSEKVARFQDGFAAWATRRGIEFDICDIIGDLLHAQENLQNVKSQSWEMPIGEWGGELGRLKLDHTLKFMNMMGSSLADEIKVEEWPEFVDGIKDEFNTGRFFHEFRYFYAQKV